MKKAIIEASFGTSYTNALDNSVLALQKRFKEDFADYDVFTVIKKENIGLIEVMGLAVLPARLKQELADLKDAILAGKDLRASEELCKHADWVEEFLPKYTVTADNIEGILEKEVGLVFAEVLTDAGVYKRTPEGRRAFHRFLATLE